MLSNITQKVDVVNLNLEQEKIHQNFSYFSLSVLADSYLGSFLNDLIFFPISKILKLKKKTIVAFRSLKHWNNDLTNI
jgi:hypothetical protein